MYIQCQYADQVFLWDKTCSILDSAYQSPFIKRNYFKKLMLKLPLRFHGYDELVKRYKVNWYYPQGIAFSSDHNRLYVSFSPNSYKHAYTVFVEYDIKSGRQIRFFQAGKFVAENFSIINRHGKKLLYTSSGHSYNSLVGVYDISNLNSGHVAELSNIGGFYVNTQITNLGDMLYVMSTQSGKSPIINIKSYLDLHHLKDNVSFITPMISSESESYPKRQAFAVGPRKNEFIVSYGGLSRLGKPVNGNVYSSIGVAIFQNNGKVVQSNLCSARVYSRIIESATNQPSTRLENEGVAVDGKGNIFTLVLNSSDKNAYFFILQEFSSDSSHSLNFESCTD